MTKKKIGSVKEEIEIDVNNKICTEIESKKSLKIRQIKSGIGCINSQISSLKGLGLKKINQVSELEDTAAVRGMIDKVKHLIMII